MFSYLINRWMISRRFEKSGEGYIYRRRPDLPGIVLTKEERLEALREFRHRYWKSWVVFLGAFLAAAFAAAVLAAALNLDQSIMSFAVFGVGIIMLAFILREQWQWSLLVEQRYANRPRVASDLPSGGWFVRYKALSRRRSWPTHVGLIALYSMILLFLAPRSLNANAVHWFFFACFAIGLGFLIFSLVIKVRQPSEH